MDKEQLTQKQLEILNYIKNYISINGYSPSIREICKGNNISSSSTVHSHINNLVNKGYLKKENKKFRTLEIVDEQKIYNIPLVYEYNLSNVIEYIKLTNKLFDINDNSFIIKITDPLNKYYNNYLICTKDNKYHEKDIVITLNDNELIIDEYNKDLNNIYAKVISIINNIK